MIARPIFAVAAFALIAVTNMTAAHADYKCAPGVSEELCAKRILEAMKATGSGSSNGAYTEDATKAPCAGGQRVGKYNNLGHGIATTYGCPKSWLAEVQAEIARQNTAGQ